MPKILGIMARGEDKKRYGPVCRDQFPKTYIVQADSQDDTCVQILQTEGIPKLFAASRDCVCLERQAIIVLAPLWHVRCIFGPKPLPKPLCKNCSHWGDMLQVHYDQHETHFRKCKKAVDISGVGPDEVLSLPADVAVSSDFEDYESSLHTGPEFGCIHFEVK